MVEVIEIFGGEDQISFNSHVTAVDGAEMAIDFTENAWFSLVVLEFVGGSFEESVSTLGNYLPEEFQMERRDQFTSVMNAVGDVSS